MFRNKLLMINNTESHKNFDKIGSNKAFAVTNVATERIWLDTTGLKCLYSLPSRYLVEKIKLEYFEKFHRTLHPVVIYFIERLLDKKIFW